ncbi:MAG: dependent oxidoreductase, partial [Myxococcales bacterium]|nr:dependent oxidoreductase [Myxococcales bacterium]
MSTFSVMPTTKTSLWADHEPPRFPKLDGALDVDVAIVGAGITGVTAARLLDDAGFSVALVDARRVGSGETKHTTAHLTEVLDGRLGELVSDFGEEGARLALRGQRAAIERIAAYVADLRLDCGFNRVPGYLVAETAEEARTLEAEAGLAKKLGLDARLVDETPLPFPVARALRFADQAQFHPRAYLTGLLAGLDGGGCRVFETTAVQEIVDGTPCRVKT